MKKNLLTLLLTLSMLLSMLAGCGSSAAGTTESSVDSETMVEASEVTEVAEESPDEAEVETETAEEEPDVKTSGSYDFTEEIANLDYSGYKEMLKTLTTALPITEEEVTITYFLGYESSTLNYIDGGVLENQQVWKWLAENTGLTFELTVVSKDNETDKFNLMVASGDYTDIVPASDYSTGVEAAYEDEVYLDLTDYIEEYMPNYWTIINADQNLYEDVQDGDKFIAIYSVKDQVANPDGTGAFIRLDWLEDLNMEIPTTYDELTEVLKAFKSEKGASEPMSLFSTVSMGNGLLMGGFGSLAELNADGAGDATNGYYQIDGTVIYGGTADGTRKYLSWLNALYNEGLIDFENMQNRETNPFSDLNAGAAADGSTGYIFTNQPFGSEYTNMAIANGDESCNWWPVQDVAEESGQTICFYEETKLVDTGNVAVTTDCENLEVVLMFLDYGYSYEGSLLYNFGFQIGSGNDVETWSYDENGEPQFDEVALNAVNETTNIASGIVATKDLAGVVFDTRLSFSFGDRELACFDAWSTNKNTSNNLGSSTTFNAEESTEAAAIYSDIVTYVATCALQFINGDKDVNDDVVWEEYVANIEAMGLADLTAIVQAAYDRANS